jgi:hypothetical protein
MHDSAIWKVVETPTPGINLLILEFLYDISGIGQGYDQVLDIPGISFEVFGLSELISGISQNEQT